MSITMLAAMAMLGQQAPLARPVAPVRIAPNAAAAVSLRRQKMLTDARALLVRAQAAQRDFVYKPGGPSKQELDAQVDQIKQDVDSMSEMGETESLRLQMAMDRMSKMMSTLSNLLKKISDTSSGITQNMK